MLKRIVEKNYKWIIAFLCLIIVLMMLEDIFENEQVTLDMVVYRLVILNLRSEPLTVIMKVITNLSSAYVLIAIAIGTLLSIKNKKIGHMSPIFLLKLCFSNIIKRNPSSTALKFTPFTCSGAIRFCYDGISSRLNDIYCTIVCTRTRSNSQAYIFSNPNNV